MDKSIQMCTFGLLHLRRFFKKGWLVRHWLVAVVGYTEEEPQQQQQQQQQRCWKYIRQYATLAVMLSYSLSISRIAFVVYVSVHVTLLTNLSSKVDSRPDIGRNKDEYYGNRSFMIWILRHHPIFSASSMLVLTRTPYCDLMFHCMY